MKQGFEFCGGGIEERFGFWERGEGIHDGFSEWFLRGFLRVVSRELGGRGKFAGIVTVLRQNNNDYLKNDYLKNYD